MKIPTPLPYTGHFPQVYGFPTALSSVSTVTSLTVELRCNTLRYVRKTLTSIRLKPEQMRRLEKIAVKEDLPVSWLIRRAIDEFLKRRK